MKKKNIAVTATAIALAVVLVLGGGTYAYLSGSTDPVTNEFDTNYNDVELDESTGEDYDIVPGTSQEKDPTVTVTYTLDSYVFVEVTDSTYDLVDWEIADGWTLLSSETVDGVTTYVYYQLLTGEGTDVTLSVLKDNQVSYSSTITNEEVATVIATYGEYNISLTFQAYIIQATLSDEDNPYVDPATAYLIASGQADTYVTGATYVSVDADYESLAAAASNDGTTVILLADADNESDAITLTSAISVTSDIVIELNGNTLAVDSNNSLSVSGGAELTLVDGAVSSSSGYGVSAVASSVGDGTTLTLSDVDVTAASTAVYAWGADVVIDGSSVTSTSYRAVYAQSSDVTITDSAISSAGMAVRLEGSGVNGNSSGSTLTITSSTITASDADNVTDDAAIGVMSTGANNVITIDDCTITSNYFGVYQNGSYSPVTITLTNSTITDSYGVGVYVSNSSADGREKQTLNINNCTISGPTAVEFKHTNATITNSTLKATADEQDASASGNGSCTTGYSLACTTNGESDKVTGDVVVTGSDVDTYFVYTVAEDYSVTINGTTAVETDSYSSTSSEE